MVQGVEMKIILSLLSSSRGKEGGLEVDIIGIYLGCDILLFGYWTRGYYFSRSEVLPYIYNQISL